MHKKTLLYVTLSIVFAIIAGYLSGTDAHIGGVTFFQIYSLIGKIFLNALNLVVLPLVAASIITGAARMGADGSFGSMGRRTLCWFFGTTTLAALTGMAFALLIQPGVGHEALAQMPLPTAGRESAFDLISKLILQVVPHNIFAVAAEGKILGVIVFSMIFGSFIPKIDAPERDAILAFFNGILKVMMKITALVMTFLPIGVFGLVAKVVAETGFESLPRVWWFFVTEMGALAFFALVILPILMRGIGGLDFWKHLKAVSPALVTAFSTSSSAATIPINMECLEEKVGISKRITSFLVPLGASLNLTGSAIYVAITVLTVSQAYGVELPLSSLVTVLLMTVIVASGMPGIPSASIVAAMMILQTLHLPAEGIGVFLIIDRFLDMCRTTVTVLGNGCCAALVARKEVPNPVPQVA